MKPLVSVIVPVYNVEKHIARCARSIFSQTYENLEIVVVNDCTPDKSIDILKSILNEFPQRIGQTQIINHVQNEGSAAVRLDGLVHTTGYYTIQIDSDDWAETDMIETLVFEAERTQADITMCDYNVVFPDRIKRIAVNPPLDPIMCMKEVLVDRVHSAFWNKLIRRSLYFDNHIMPTPGLDMWEDMSVMYKLMYYAKKLAYVARPLYNYNQSNLLSYTNGVIMSTARKRRCAMQIVSQMNDFVAQTDELPQDAQTAFIHYKITHFAGMLLEQNKISDQDRILLNGITASTVLSHPTLNRFRKLACLLSLCHRSFLVGILRCVFRLRHKDCFTK